MSTIDDIPISLVIMFQVCEKLNQQQRVYGQLVSVEVPEKDLLEKHRAAKLKTLKSIAPGKPPKVRSTGLIAQIFDQLIDYCQYEYAHLSVSDIRLIQITPKLWMINGKELTVQVYYNNAGFSW